MVPSSGSLIRFDGLFGFLIFLLSYPEDEGEVSAPVQTRPGGHPASYTMGAESFPEVKRPGCAVDHPPPSSAEVKERVQLYIYSLSGLSWLVVGLTSPLP